MIPRYLLSMWSDVAPALGDHLWQSTVFAAAAGLLTLTVRKNQARARYWLWMAASLKFLVPFSALVTVGSRLAWWRSSAGVKSGLYLAVEQVSQPFVQGSVFVGSRGGSAAVSSGLVHLLPAVLAGVWLCGCVGVLFMWWVRWRGISAAIRSAEALREGREVEALRRLERVAGIRKPVEVRLSRSTLEPGIFGLTQPVLVWPEGISERLDDAQLEAVLAHELWHVQRRDNLAAAVHMTVEAIFWFHPLVWWLGARLVDERERACDEEVLVLGSERQVYAESILKVCEFCVGSPLACVSGVTGADLKRRMVHIMSEQVVRKLDFSRRLLLSAAAVVAIAAPIVFGLVHATPTRAQSQAETSNSTTATFESVSIKPSQLLTPINVSGTTQKGMEEKMPLIVKDNNPQKVASFRVEDVDAVVTQDVAQSKVPFMVKIGMMYSPDGFSASNATLRSVIQEAYDVQASQIEGPSELLDSAYDIEAKIGKSDGERSPGQGSIQSQQMLQALLADRFKLVFHRESKQLSSYALVVAESGPKLQVAQPGIHSDEVKGPDGRPMGAHRILMQLGDGHVVGMTVQATSLNEIAEELSVQLGSAVVDKTGLKGSYDFNLHWTSDANGALKDGEASADSAPAASGPTLFEAIQDQLGLKLEAQKGPMQILVIDHVEAPAAD